MQALENNPMAIGVLALARPTFDVPYAEEMAAKAFATLDAAGLKTIGPRTLLFDADAAKKLDALLLLQVTFTDASMTLELAGSIKAPLAIWAFPEPRTGGRLRLNSFCGLNLAGHALGRAGVNYRYLFQDADKPLGAGLASFADYKGADAVRTLTKKPTTKDKAVADRVLADLKGRRIGLVGEHPAGFDTCRYDASTLSQLTGITIDRFALAELFARSTKTTPAATAKHRKDVAHLKGIEDVDQAQLDKSLTLFEGLASLKSDNGLSAFAVRCWPEMFTEYGCAICGPMGMMNGSGVPAACEADVYGAVIALMLQQIAQEPSWLVDIVDMDARDSTSVFWHCGSAPASMRDPAYEAEAQIHSNRKMPLLYQFPLKPGRFTFARLSQANNQPHLLVGSGEVIRAPISFTGTSGVVKLDAPLDKALHGLIGGGYEHHVAMVYGNHTGAMAALGQSLGLPVRHMA
jgi:L-fucose isomerase-like protein